MHTDHRDCGSDVAAFGSFSNDYCILLAVDSVDGRTLGRQLACGSHACKSNSRGMGEQATHTSRTRSNSWCLTKPSANDVERGQHCRRSSRSENKATSYDVQERTTWWAPSKYENKARSKTTYEDKASSKTGLRQI